MYRLREKVVEAERWMGQDVDGLQIFGRIGLLDDLLLVRLGDWIIMPEAGERYVMSDDLFCYIYEEVQ